MVLRYRPAALRGRRWHRTGDDGFSLIEVIVALGLLMIVMLSTAGFFVQSLKTSATQSQQQQASQLANQQLEYTRSVPAKALLYGRSQAQVSVATSAPGITDLSHDVISDFNYDGWDGALSGQTSQVVPIVMPTQNVGGTIYTTTTFIDRCYVTFGANQSCIRTASAGASWLYRITVNVSWMASGGRSCATASRACQFVVSTLRDPGTDPCFNVNVSYAGCSVAQPLINGFSPNTVATNSTTSMVITGVNFDPGAKVTVDPAVGTVSNVVVGSTTSITFTLTTNNTLAAVGPAQVVRVTNLNGKFALGTIAVTTSALNVNSVSPTTVYAGTTTTLVISGSGFQPGSVVSVPATDGTISGTPVITANTISVSFVAGSTTAALGPASVTVTNPDGATGFANFTIVTAPVTFTAITPSTIVYQSQRTFVLTGSGFNAGAQVTIDGAAVSEVVNSSTSITVNLTFDPTAGPHVYVITNPDGGTASKTFTVTAGLTITGVTPNPAFANTKTFTVTGTNFLTGIVAKVSGATVQTTTRTSSTLLTVTLTSGSTLAQGTPTLTLTNLDASTASATFAVVSPPVIASVTPSTGTKNASTPYTITGVNFLGTGTQVLLTGAVTATVTGTITSPTSVTFSYALPRGQTGTYSEQVQLKFADGTVSNVVPWTLVVS
jgi:Tfp pilus assembly protein PilV